MTTVHLPYVDSALDHLDRGGPASWWHHLHWGLYDDPAAADDSPEAYVERGHRPHRGGGGRGRRGRRPGGARRGLRVRGHAGPHRGPQPGLPAGRAQHRRAPAALGAAPAGPGARRWWRRTGASLPVAPVVARPRAGGGVRVPLRVPQGVLPGGGPGAAPGRDAGAVRLPAGRRGAGHVPGQGGRAGPGRLVRALVGPADPGRLRAPGARSPASSCWPTTTSPPARCPPTPPAGGCTGRRGRPRASPPSTGSRRWPPRGRGSTTCWPSGDGRERATHDPVPVRGAAHGGARQPHAGRGPGAGGPGPRGGLGRTRGGGGRAAAARRHPAPGAPGRRGAGPHRGPGRRPAGRGRAQAPGGRVPGAAGGLHGPRGRGRGRPLPARRPGGRPAGAGGRGRGPGPGPALGHVGHHVRPPGRSHGADPARSRSGPTGSSGTCCGPPGSIPRVAATVDLRFSPSLVLVFSTPCLRGRQRLPRPLRVRGPGHRRAAGPHAVPVGVAGPRRPARAGHAGHAELAQRRPVLRRRRLGAGCHGRPRDHRGAAGAGARRPRPTCWSGRGCRSSPCCRTWTRWCATAGTTRCARRWRTGSRWSWPPSATTSRPSPPRWRRRWRGCGSASAEPGPTSCGWPWRRRWATARCGPAPTGSGSRSPPRAARRMAAARLEGLVPAVRPAVS